MNDIIFFNDFIFNEFHQSRLAHTDNSHGVEKHFIGLMKKGSALILSKDIRLELSVGDMFYIPKGLSYHSWWNTDGGGAVYDSIGFLNFPLKSLGGFALQKIERSVEIDRLFIPLSQNKTINCASIGTLYTLLGFLEDKLIPATFDREDEVVSKLLVLMNKDHNRTVSEYAQALSVSEAALYLYTKRKLGKTPNRLRQEVCCNKACELLTTTNYSVEHICDLCGFSSASYFRKVLFSVRGKTPSAVRKESKPI